MGGCGTDAVLLVRLTGPLRCIPLNITINSSLLNCSLLTAGAVVMDGQSWRAFVVVVSNTSGAVSTLMSSNASYVSFAQADATASSSSSSTAAASGPSSSTASVAANSSSSQHWAGSSNCGQQHKLIGLHCSDSLNERAASTRPRAELCCRTLRARMEEKKTISRCAAPGFISTQRREMAGQGRNAAVSRRRAEPRRTQSLAQPLAEGVSRTHSSGRRGGEVTVNDQSRCISNINSQSNFALFAATLSER